MPVTLINKETKQSTQTKNKHQEIVAELVDKFATEKTLVTSLKATLKKAEGALKETQGQLTDMGAVEAESKKETYLEGNAHDITISKSKSVTVVTDRNKVKSLLGDTFEEVWGVGIGDLKKYLSPAQIEEVTSKEDGSRTWKATEKL